MYMTNAERVFKVIAENPGINGGDIIRMIKADSGYEISIKHLNSILGGLKRRNYDAVENRGSTGLSGRWYVVVPKDPEPVPYLDDAHRILRELKRIIPNQRALWLAEQLQALIED